MNTDCCSPVVRENREASTYTRKPRYRVRGSDEAYFVEVELPGVAKGDVSLRVEDGILTVTSSAPAALPDSWKPVHRELSPAAYELRLRLHSKVDDAQMKARLEDGVLHLELPLREAAKPREIAIG